MLKQIFLVLLLVPITQFAFAEEIPDYDKPYAPIFFNKHKDLAKVGEMVGRSGG